MRVGRSTTTIVPGSSRSPRPGSDPPGSTPAERGHWEPSPVRRLLRRPSVLWGVAGALALVAAAIVADTTAEAARLRDGYGATRDVLVTDETVGAGASLAGAVSRQTLPVAAIPADALDVIDPTATSAGSISAGAVVTRQDIAAADGLGADEAAIAVPTGPAVPATRPGTPVWVVIAADPFAGLDPALVSGRVLTATDDAVTVVVAVTDLTAVSAATGAGVAGLALRGE